MIAKRNIAHQGFYCHSPDNKIYTKNSNYFNNVTDSSGNVIKNDNLDKLYDTNKNINTLGEIKPEINQDNISMRNSMIPKENRNN